MSVGLAYHLLRDAAERAANAHRVLIESGMEGTEAAGAAEDATALAWQSALEVAATESYCIAVPIAVMNTCAYLGSSPFDLSQPASERQRTAMAEQELGYSVPSRDDNESPRSDNHNQEVRR